MKRIIYILAIFLAAWPYSANACVMKTISIGIVDAGSIRPALIAEIISTMINERTGTKVEIKTFTTASDLYAAVEKKEVGIMIEDTGNAGRILNRDAPREQDPSAAYETVKAGYMAKMKLVWMKPLGFLTGLSGKEQSLTAPVVRDDILVNIFPGLPRVLNKLENKISDQTLNQLTSLVESGQKPGHVAREFLKNLKLI